MREEKFGNECLNETKRHLRAYQLFAVTIKTALQLIPLFSQRL